MELTHINKDCLCCYRRVRNSSKFQAPRWVSTSVYEPSLYTKWTVATGQSIQSLKQTGIHSESSPITVIPGATQLTVRIGEHWRTLLWDRHMPILMLINYRYRFMEGMSEDGSYRRTAFCIFCGTENMCFCHIYCHIFPPSQNFSLNIKKILLCRPCLTLRRKSSPWKMRMEEDKILKMSNSWMKLGVTSFILKVYYTCMNTSGFGGGVLFAFGFIYFFWIKLANLCTSSGKFPQATIMQYEKPQTPLSHWQKFLAHGY